MKTVAVVGSRNPQGRTAQAVNAFCQSAAKEASSVDIFMLPSMKIERCRQCDNQGWGTCRFEGRCCIDDDIHQIIDAIAEADLVLFATPVYWGDLSESLRALTDRLRRISTNEKGTTKFAGKKAIGICVAGGGGGGAPECGASLIKPLLTTGFDVVDMVLARRQNLESKCKYLAARAVEPAK
ncbi:MAG: flavodoxin family protein [Chitinivibrionales bacterium]|nr:flavodoxin family protein [Chitinivibrionales bacterium]